MESVHQNEPICNVVVVGIEVTINAKKGAVIVDFPAQNYAVIHGNGRISTIVDELINW